MSRVTFWLTLRWASAPPHPLHFCRSTLHRLQCSPHSLLLALLPAPGLPPHSLLSPTQDSRPPCISRPQALPPALLLSREVLLSQASSMPSVEAPSLLLTPRPPTSQSPDHQPSRAPSMQSG